MLDKSHWVAASLQMFIKYRTPLTFHSIRSMLSSFESKIVQCNFFGEWVDWLNEIKMNKPFIDSRFLLLQSWYLCELQIVIICNFNNHTTRPLLVDINIQIEVQLFCCHKTHFVFHRAVQHQWNLPYESDVRLTSQKAKNTFD